jgi:hypothetical protein
VDTIEIDEADVQEPRSRWAAVASIAVGAVTLLAVLVAFIAIRAQSFLPEFSQTLGVVAGAESDLSAPWVDAASYESVTLRVSEELTSPRWWYALSLASVYSIVIVGLALVSLLLWRLRTQRSFARAASWSLGGFGVWAIIAVVLQEFSQNQSIRALVDQLGLPTMPAGDKAVDVTAEGSTYVLLPTFAISQPILLVTSIGIVMILAAVLLGRAWRMQTELDEVI